MQSHQLTRRAYLSGAATAATVAMAPHAFAQTNELVIEEQQGDPTLAIERVQFDPDRIHQLQSPDVRADLAPRIPNFGDVLLSTAREFLGKNRVNAEPEITEMLAVLRVGFRSGNPPELTAYCAGGVTFCAALAYARSQNQDLTTQKIAKLRRYLIEVGQYHFYPTVSVIDMWKVADGHRRAHPRTAHGDVQPGWLVVFNWAGTNDYHRANHVAIVERYDRDAGVFHTIEFNTCLEGDDGGSQGNGGEITQRRRRFGNTVKGFIDTSARNRLSDP